MATFKKHGYRMLLFRPRFWGGHMVLGRILNAATTFTLGHVLNEVIGPSLGLRLKKVRP